MADEPRDEPLTERPKYDQKFFLALAAKGGDAWNAWRRDPANNDVRVTFVGVDFSQAPRDRIDFSGFQFGNEADFSFCNWRGEIWKGRPEAFGQGRAMFIGAGFGDGASFRGVTFGDRPDFYGAAFGGGPPSPARLLVNSPFSPKPISKVLLNSRDCPSSNGPVTLRQPRKRWGMKAARH
jgi:hypothetical protein